MREYGDGLPILLPYQSRWNADPADVAVCLKSRRIGLSWGYAAEVVLYASEGRGDVYYMSYNKDMTSGFIQDCSEWAEFYNVVAGAMEEILVTDGDRQYTMYRIQTDSGKSITALPGEARNLRSKGRPGELLIIDEAAFCDDLAALLKAGLAFTQWGGLVRVISTPNGEDNAYWELVEDVMTGRKPGYALHTITLDDAIGEGLARRIFTVTEKPWTRGAAASWRAAQIAKYKHREDADEELFCIPKRSGGAYFPRALVRPCMAEVPIVRFTGDEPFNRKSEPDRREIVSDWIDEQVRPLLRELDPRRRHAFGMDFGRSVDLSVIVPLEVTETVGLRCPFMVEMPNVPNKQQEQVVKAIGWGLPRFFACKLDGTGNGNFVAEAAVDEWGETIAENVHLTAAWYVEHLPPYKAALEDRNIEIPLSDDVLDDHRAFQVVNGRPTLPSAKTGAKQDRHGDGAMALILAHAAATGEVREYEYSSAGPRVSGGLDEWMGTDAAHGAVSHAAARRVLHGDVMRW